MPPMVRNDVFLPQPLKAESPRSGFEQAEGANFEELLGGLRSSASAQNEQPESAAKPERAPRPRGSANQDEHEDQSAAVGEPLPRAENVASADTGAPAVDVAEVLESGQAPLEDVLPRLLITDPPDESTPFTEQLPQRPHESTDPASPTVRVPQPTPLKLKEDLVPEVDGVDQSINEPALTDPAGTRLAALLTADQAMPQADAGEASTEVVKQLVSPATSVPPTSEPEVKPQSPGAPAGLATPAAPAAVQQPQNSTADSGDSGEQPPNPSSQHRSSNAPLAADSEARSSQSLIAAPEQSGVERSPASSIATRPGPAPASISLVGTSTVTAAPTPAEASPTAPPLPAGPAARETEFVSNNHERLVTVIRTQLLPRGGTMQLRLDPPELGTLQLAVRMHEGVMSVSFQTSNEEATKLLSHSLSHLKQVLESSGVSVDKLHVQQSSRNDSSDRQPGDQQQRQGLHDDSAQQEQQRREMLRRMWRRLAIGNDPLDLVA